MKDKQFVIAILLLLVGLYTIRCTFAGSSMDHFLHIKVPKMKKHLEDMILSMRNKAKHSGASDNLKGDDTTSGNSPTIPGLTAASSPESAFGKMTVPGLSTINQVGSSAACSSIFGHLFKH